MFEVYYIIDNLPRDKKFDIGNKIMKIFPVYGLTKI